MTEQQLDLIVRLIKHMLCEEIDTIHGRYNSSEAHGEMAMYIIEKLKGICHEEVNGAETN